MFRNHLCECEVRAASVRIEKVEFSKTLMRPGGVHGQNEHNSGNQFCSRNSCVISIVYAYMKGRQFKDIKSTD